MTNGTALAVDTNDNVYVTGSAYDASSDYDFTTIKYSNAGVPFVDQYLQRAGKRA